MQVAAGYTEGSNVNAAEQMVTMISLARQFEMQMKVLTSADANDRAATRFFPQMLLSSRPSPLPERKAVSHD
jgi:flagellar basal body rod protein FlgF